MPDSREIRKRFEIDPEYYYEYRSRVEIAMASGFESLWRGGFAAKGAREDTIRHMDEIIKDPVI